VGVLILLPVFAITCRAFQVSPAVLWRSITHPHALYSLKVTLIAALAVTLINTVTGTIVAWTLVKHHFPGKKLLNTLIDIPFAIPTVVTGIMLVAFFGPNSVVGALFEGLGIQIIFNKPAIVLALMYVTFPFVVRSVQPVLLTMERDMEEAARTLGAGRTAIFFKVVLPAILPAVLSGAALSFSRALGEFGSVVVVAGNIPMKSQVSSVYIYGEIESYNISGALALSLTLLICSFIIIFLLNYLQKWGKKYADHR
jgi:sulfate transport system permease protein